MPKETINKIRKALNYAKSHENTNETLSKVNSLFEESLKENLVRSEKIDFNDVVLYEHKSFSSLGCYLCNGDTFVMLNVKAHPDFVNHWKIKPGKLGEKIEQAIVFFESGSNGVAELVLSKYEIEKKRI